MSQSNTENGIAEDTSEESLIFDNFCMRIHDPFRL